jgi:large subunit ribosomal protein L30
MAEKRKRTTAGKKAKATKKKMLKVTLLRGLAGKREEHVIAVKSLGLRKPGQSRVLEDNPMVRGNIRKAHYLIKVEEITDEAS